MSRLRDVLTVLAPFLVAALVVGVVAFATVVPIVVGAFWLFDGYVWSGAAMVALGVSVFSGALTLFLADL